MKHPANAAKRATTQAWLRALALLLTAGCWASGPLSAAGLSTEAPAAGGVSAPAALAGQPGVVAPAATATAGPSGPSGQPPQAQATAAAAPEAPMLALQAVPLQPGEHLRLTGLLDHPAWQRAPVHRQFEQRAPLAGVAPPQATEVRLLYDSQALYVGVRALDSAPELIRAPLVARDGVNRTQDFVAVYVDAVGQRQSAQFFRVNASGALGDGMHTAADDHEDFGPDFDWDAAAHRDAQGWTAVLRIPFASLRFPQGATTWRLMVLRRLPRAQNHLFTSVEIPLSAPSFIATLQPLAGLQLPPSPHFLTLRPGLTLRRSQDTAADGRRTQRQTAEASLDLKWRPLPELVLDAALNPDFSQVALDEPQLQGNNRFALQLLEKRPFFYESSDLLRSPTEALYTRSISDPRWGLRATWRGAALAGTAFAVHDAGGGLVLLPGAFDTAVAEQPASRVLGLRLQADAQALAPGLQLGWLGSARQYSAGLGNNQVLGPDLAWQLNSDWRLRLQWLASRTTARAQASGQLAEGAAADGQRLFAKLWYQAPSREVELTLEDTSAGFRNDQGFQPQAGVQVLSTRWATGWHPLGPFNDFWLNLGSQHVRTRDTGQWVSRDVFPEIWFTGALNLDAWLKWHGLRQVRVAADRPLRDERYLEAGVMFSPAEWAPLFEAEGRFGRLLDVAADQVRPGAHFWAKLMLRPHRRIELQPRLAMQWLDGPGGQRAYREAVPSVLLRWHLDARQSLRLILQRSQQRRLAEPARPDHAALAAASDSATVGTLTWAWRLSTGTTVYLGGGRARQPGADPARQNELFAKLQVDVDELRRR